MSAPSLRRPTRGLTGAVRSLAPGGATAPRPPRVATPRACSDAPPAPLLTAHELAVRAGARALLDGVSLQLFAGELVAVVGPNGAGKSTLLGALAGDLSPHGGSVRLAGRPLPDWSPRALATRRAVVRQHSSLDADFTASEVVALARPGASAAQLAAALDEVGLGERAHQRYPSLSGGERARVHLARALLQLADRDEAVLLLDEPTAALDPREQHRALALVRAHTRRGLAALVILHDLGLAARYADRVAVLSRGHLLTCGPTERALCPEVLAAAFQLDFELVATRAGLVPLATPPSTE